MPSKKTSNKPSKAAASNGNKSPKASNRNGTPASRADLAEAIRTNRPTPYMLIEGETPEQREKRLARRKAMTIKAFQMAYEDHQARKAS